MRKGRGPASDSEQDVVMLFCSDARWRGAWWDRQIGTLRETLAVMRWLQLRFVFDSTVVRLPIKGR